MTKLLKNVSLKPYNTFGFDVRASEFVEIESQESLISFLRNKRKPALFLGGGSNVLLTQDVDGLVMVNAIKGISTIERETEVEVTVCSGENWHEFVLWAVKQGWGGIENLSLIPGTVGAAPMQNIGAYGVEIKDVFVKLEAVHVDTCELKTFNLKDCEFGYRESVFKHRLKGQYIILNVTFCLQKHPKINVAYGAIREILKEMGIADANIKEVSNAVMAIRRSKLPDPAEIGNSGSFFKNPEVPIGQFELIKKQYPDMPSYPINESTIKLPAGWLIEKAGWKGYRDGEVGVHAKQALVLVHYGGGKGRQVKELSKKIQDDVQTKFGIKLNPEVNFV